MLPDLAMLVHVHMKPIYEIGKHLAMLLDPTVLSMMFMCLPVPLPRTDVLTNHRLIQMRFPMGSLRVLLVLMTDLPFHLTAP